LRNSRKHKTVVQLTTGTWPDATTTLRRKMNKLTLRTICKKVRTLWRRFRKNWSGYTVTLVIELTATIFGVFFGLTFSDIWQQRNLDTITRERLYLALLESEYNSSYITEVLETFSEDTSTDTLRARQTDTSSAIAAINDQNILSVLPLHSASLLVSYISSQKTLNYLTRLHNDYLLSNQQNSNTKHTFSNGIIQTAAHAAAMCDALKRELPIYYDKTQYDQATHDSIQDYITQRQDYITQRQDYYQEKYKLTTEE